MYNLRVIVTVVVIYQLDALLKIVQNILLQFEMLQEKILNNLSSACLNIKLV